MVLFHSGAAIQVRILQTLVSLNGRLLTRTKAVRNLQAQRARGNVIETLLIKSVPPFGRLQSAVFLERISDIQRYGELVFQQLCRNVKRAGVVVFRPHSELRRSLRVRIVSSQQNIFVKVPACIQREIVHKIFLQERSFISVKSKIPSVEKDICG